MHALETPPPHGRFEDARCMFLLQAMAFLAVWRLCLYILTAWVPRWCKLARWKCITVETDSFPVTERNEFLREGFGDFSTSFLAVDILSREVV